MQKLQTLDRMNRTLSLRQTDAIETQNREMVFLPSLTFIEGVNSRYHLDPVQQYDQNSLAPLDDTFRANQVNIETKMRFSSFNVTCSLPPSYQLQNYPSAPNNNNTHPMLPLFNQSARPVR